MSIPGGEGIGGVRKKDKEYELSTTDTFWNKHKGSPFPQVDKISVFCIRIKTDSDTFNRNFNFSP